MPLVFSPARTPPIGTPAGRSLSSQHQSHACLLSRCTYYHQGVPRLPLRRKGARSPRSPVRTACLPRPPRARGSQWQEASTPPERAVRLNLLVGRAAFGLPRPPPVGSAGAAWSAACAKPAYLGVRVPAEPSEEDFDGVASAGSPKLQKKERGKKSRRRKKEPCNEIENDLCLCLGDVKRC